MGRAGTWRLEAGTGIDGASPDFLRQGLSLVLGFRLDSLASEVHTLLPECWGCRHVLLLLVFAQF